MLISLILLHGDEAHSVTRTTETTVVQHSSHCSGETDGETALVILAHVRTSYEHGEAVHKPKRIAPGSAELSRASGSALPNYVVGTSPSARTQTDTPRPRPRRRNQRPTGPPDSVRRSRVLGRPACVRWPVQL